MALRVQHEADEVVLFENCIECDKITSARLPRSVWDDWAGQGPNAPFVQYAFPTLSASQREALFLSRICGDCWDRIFSRYEED